MTDGSFRLSTEFWADFVEEFWEKKPTVIPRPFVDELISQSEALAALRLGFHDTGRDPSLRRYLYVGGEMQDGPVSSDLLPAEGDASVPEFSRRLLLRRPRRQEDAGVAVRVLRRPKSQSVCLR